MQSFSEYIKFEIISFKWNDEQLKILLKTIFLNNGKFYKNEFKINFQILGLAKKIAEISKKFLGIEFILKKNSLHSNQIKEITNFINTTNINFKNENDLTKAFISSMFLAKGSCNSPENKNYHLEIRAKKISDALDLVECLKLLGIESKKTIKNNWYYIYIKSPQLISDFLKCVNAFESLSNFENEKIQKDFLVTTQKLERIELVNLLKTKRAAEKQILIINQIIQNEKKWNEFPKHVQNLFLMRREKQNFTYDDLKNHFNLKYNTNYSKSAINYWLRNLYKI